ncbi:uncharacterized protein LOC128354439 isoform X2, partial [Scomber scombrus]
DQTSRPVSPAFEVPLAVCSSIIIIIFIIFFYFRHKNRKAAAAYSQSLKPQWQYEGERSGDWCDFIETRKCSVTSDEIEEQYQENNNGKMRLAGEEYELDFKAKTKTNLTTGKARMIRRVLLPPASPPAEEETSTQNTTSAPGTSNETEMRVMLPAVRHTSNQEPTSVVTRSNSNIAGFKPQWEYERSGGGWHDFRKKRGLLNECSVTNDEIQRWYQENPNVKMSLTVDGKPCELDFKKMILTNLEDTTESHIRFVFVLPPRFLKAVFAAFPLKSRFAGEADGTEQDVQESSNQDSTSVVTHSNSNRAVISTVSEVHETSAQDLEAPSNDTAEPSSLPAVEETSTQKTTSAAAPETSNETE